MLSIKGRTTLRERWKYYWEEGWNKLDVVVIALFSIGMLLVLVPYDQAYHIRRLCLSVDFVLSSMRLLQAFAVGQDIGPILTMILKMLRDTVAFVVILFVFILSYAVASESILFPQSTLDSRMLYYVPRKAYWQIYGDFFLGEIEGTDPECTNDAALYSNYTMPRCPSAVGKYVVPILLAVYCIITHVLLLNLLIAKFNDTYSKVQGEAKIHWAWYRCQIIHEYAVRPSLPPPLNAFSCLYWLVRHAAMLVKDTVCCKCCPQRCRKHFTMSASCSHAQQSLREKVSVGTISPTTVDLYWRDTENKAVSRHRICCYKMKDHVGTSIERVTDVYNPYMVITLYAKETYTVKGLEADTRYKMKIQNEKDSEWRDPIEIDIRTDKQTESTRTEQHEVDCVQQIEKLQSEDPIINRLDSVMKTVSCNKQEITQSFQQVKGDLNQLTQKVQELDKAATQAINKQIYDLRDQIAEMQQALLERLPTSNKI